MSGGGYSVLESGLAVKRTRASWNDWLEKAERPASDSEEAKIERAATMARNIVVSNRWLSDIGAVVAPQGSYYNNTNVRKEADMDLRVELPQIRTLNISGNADASLWPSLGIVDSGMTFDALSARARGELTSDLISKFGRENVDASSKKAIKVAGLDGSRADCDIVPTFRLFMVEQFPNGYISQIEGVSILGTDGSWTDNFPSQHYANGVRKRQETSHRFKRNVRMLKRINYELEAFEEIRTRLPSFFIECLVYRVENQFFLDENDDRWLRLRQILYRLHHLLSDDAWCGSATEINDIKFLFHLRQPWTRLDAQAFIVAAINRLEA